MPPSARLVPCVGGIVLDGRRRLLVIRRRHAPAQGLWSIPGGRLEDGESPTEGVHREVMEETGLSVRIGELAGIVERPGPNGATYLIHDYRCEYTGGQTPRAGDDADDVRWVSRGELMELPIAPGLLEALTEWNALPD